MSQQYVEFEGSHQAESHRYEGYMETPRLTGTGNRYGQKLASHNSPTPAQRLILAIVSLVLWMILFGVTLSILASHVYPSYAYGSPGVFETVFYIFLCLGMVAFSVLALVINIMFNRKS